MIRKAKAVWRGTGRAGGGNLSHRFQRARSTLIPSRPFENEKGAIELISAVQLLHDSAGILGCRPPATPTELDTEAAVTLEPEGRIPHQPIGSDAAPGAEPGRSCVCSHARARKQSKFSIRDLWD